MQILLTILRKVLVVAGVAAVSLYLAMAFRARQMPDLNPEHRIEFDAEFRASQESRTDWPAYLATEDRLARQLDALLEGKARVGNLRDRHELASPANPGRLAINWNRSYEMRAESPRGVAVLLHGLSDSPYSMRETANTLVEAGISVVAPRMPGHGFAVGALRGARWEDWSAAVRIAVARATEINDGDLPLLLAGYSNGALLALDYALQCDGLSALPCPDRLMLMSPAIAVPKVAMLSTLHQLLSWLPFFEQFQWVSVAPEIDPFKFTSFPKRAGWEVYELSRRTRKALADPVITAELPPVLTFQSVVDNTVSVEAVIANLYDVLPANGSGIMLYDVNRHNAILYRRTPEDPLAAFRRRAPLPYSVTIVRNRSRDTLGVELATLRAGDTEFEAEARNLRWPDEFFTLSHIAIPFSPGDELYGDGSAPTAFPVRLGATSPRGEAGVLSLGPEYFLRARYNPFSELQADVMLEWLREL